MALKNQTMIILNPTTCSNCSAARVIFWRAQRGNNFGKLCPLPKYNISRYEKGITSNNLSLKENYRNKLFQKVFYSAKLMLQGSHPSFWKTNYRLCFRLDAIWYISKPSLFWGSVFWVVSLELRSSSQRRKAMHQRVLCPAKKCKSSKHKITWAVLGSRIW